MNVTAQGELRVEDACTRAARLVSGPRGVSHRPTAMTYK
jgi:hypothetical protein